MKTKEPKTLKYSNAYTASTKKKEGHKVVISLIIFLLLLFLLLELAARKFLPEDVVYINRSLSWDHYRGAPDVFLEYQTYIFSEEIGFENAWLSSFIENKSKESKIKFRVLVLGDSISENGDYLIHLRGFINNEFPERFEIINTGTVGYDPVIEKTYLELRALAVNPDVIILQLSSNDASGTPVVVKQPDGKWFAYDRDALPLEINPLLFTYSRAYRGAILLFEGYRKPQTGVFLEAALEKIQEISDANNIPLVTVYFPYFGIQTEDNAPDGDVLRAVNLSGIKNLLDLRQSFSEANFSNVAQDNFHPNEEGHYLAAEKLYTFILPILFELNSTEIV